MELAAMALEAALELLRPGGAFVTKLFQGAGFEEFVAEARSRLGAAKLPHPGGFAQGQPRNLSGWPRLICYNSEAALRAPFQCGSRTQNQ